MGIDVYLRWDGQTEAEKKAQYTGFSIVHGHVGYLREAYHGEPYATVVLVGRDALEEGEARVRSSVLRERLPDVIAAAIKRNAEIYGEESTEDSPEVKTFADFVALHEKKEAAGLNPVIIVSG